MHSSADDISAWLASLSDKALRRLFSRLNYILRLIAAEIHRRDSKIRNEGPI